MNGEKLSAGCEVRRSFRGGVFFHTGIYVGKGRVVHFGERGPGEPLRAQQVAECSLEEFSRGEKVRVGLQPRNPAHARAVVRQAYALLRKSDNGFDGKYNLVLRNCEDFTRHCSRVGAEPRPRGRFRPTQRARILMALAALPGGLAALAGGLAAARTLRKRA